MTTAGWVAAIVVTAAIAAVGGATAWARRGDDRRLARTRLAGGPSAPAVPAGVTRAAVRLGVAAPTPSGWAAARVAGVAVVALAAAWAPIPAVLTVTAAVAVGPVARRFAARRPPPPDDLPATVDALVAPLAAGRSLRQAVAAAADRPGPSAAGLAVVDTRIGQGWAAQDALDDWAGRADDPGARLVADALALAGRTGASQVGALGCVGATLRERAALHREIRALGSQARLSAAVLVVTPVGFAVAVAALDPRIGRFLTHQPAGWACLVVGGGLDGVGAWWMHRLTVAAGR